MSNLRQEVPSAFDFIRSLHQKAVGIYSVPFLPGCRSTMTFSAFLVGLLLSGLRLAFTAPLEVDVVGDPGDNGTHSVLVKPSHQAGAGCFPAIGFQMPSTVPKDTSNWWCDSSTEYAFLGFSYEVTECKVYLVVHIVSYPNLIP